MADQVVDEHEVEEDGELEDTLVKASKSKITLLSNF